MVEKQRLSNKMGKWRISAKSRGCKLVSTSKTGTGSLGHKPGVCLFDPVKGAPSLTSLYP